MMVQSIIENLQRENLNPIEEARAYESLVEKGFTHAEIADKMGKSRPYISNSIRLLSLPDCYPLRSRKWQTITSSCAFSSWVE